MYAELNHEVLLREKADVDRQFEEIKARGLKLNMARGKPGDDQLELSLPLLTNILSHKDCIAEDGTDCRNYGAFEGLPEAKRLMAAMLDDEPENIIVGGCSSLSLMYNAVSRCATFGTLGSTPWSKLDVVKWLCPVPGYDRHFRITETFGFEMIPIPMTSEGPDMDLIESLVADDDSIKGIWCVPKYSNPDGTTYSDETVRRLASMPCAAEDFRIFWDNAYCVHHLFDDQNQQDQLLDIAVACAEAGNPNRYFKFASTSKVTFPGAGISGIASSPENMDEIRRLASVAIISYDKVNQMRHVKLLKDADGIATHMRKHALILRPKFALVQEKLEAGLAEVGGCSWTKPRGGYFVSFSAPNGCAKRIVALAKEAGVVLTSAGATWPYGDDPKDSNIRIAPTLPPIYELDEALDVFICCVKRAYLERLLGY